MKLLQRLKNSLLGQNNSSKNQFYTVIQDRQAAMALLDEHHSPITGFAPYGDIPVALAIGTVLRLTLVPQSDVFTGIRLRFGTYCRVNQCHITVRLNDFSHRFNAGDLVDNEYVDIPLPTRRTCVAGQPMEVEIYSEDAAEENMVAVWCARMVPQFVQTLDLESMFFLPETEQCRVSIVIPVFNKALYTYNCLLTLLACDSDISKEVIIVNNASVDETGALLKQLGGAFKVIDNEQNQGFVGACRQGADLATGEFILFLNNDTQVMPGWLSNLVNVMDDRAKVGIVGSKLIYPDGRLQEAGGIIFNDASGWNYGRLQDPTVPHINQSREVDYCSGACLMIRRSLWEQLGGFDKRYAPAYYEDTDLCLAARQAGYQVLYCHDSQVIHHEGITAGTDILSGYKVYQAINRKKFQAKWWNVLSVDHPPPPPQTSPESAAFRFMVPNGVVFRVPNQKVLATHLLGQGWAANFWSYLNLNQVDEELFLIQSVGFNTVIILVPWVGFQTQVAPISYYEEYFTLFKLLLEKVQEHGFQVILRLGYTHDNGPDSEPEGYLRQIVIAEDSVMLKAWCDYLDRLWAIVRFFPNVLGGFITWEDFFFMDLTHIPLEQRLLYAERTGYRRYLEKHYCLEEVSVRYKESFADYGEVPIPVFNSSGIHLFCEFWDKVLIEVIFSRSKNHFPPLSMEVRTDCEPQQESYICHDSTFDLSSDTHLTTIYYTPAWGAPNDGGLESADRVLERMQSLFEQLRRKTHNVIFIDQLNFIDNTPGFEHNTGILPAEVPQFLAGAADILQHNTIGYSLWTLRDVRANALKNGLFERNYRCWDINSGKVVFDAMAEKKAAWLELGGTLSQVLAWCVGVPLVKDKPFQLDFKVRKAPGTIVMDKILLRVFVVYQNQMVYDETIFSEPSESWQDIHLEGIPFYLGYELNLDNRGVPVLLSDFYLYQVYQENGIIDAAGQKKSFYDDLVLLNQKLSHQQIAAEKFFFSERRFYPGAI